MEHAVREGAARRNAVGGVNRLREGPCPKDVALPRVLGSGQGNQPTDALQASLEGQVTEGSVAIAFFAIDVSGESIVTPGRRKLRLGCCHPGRRVSPLTLGPRLVRVLPWRTTP